MVGCVGFLARSVRERSSGLWAAIEGVVEVIASFKLFVRSHAMMNFRWGVRVPTEIKKEKMKKKKGSKKKF